MKEEWNGFVDLLANRIEKYAAVLDLDNLAESLYSFDGKETTSVLEHYGGVVEMQEGHDIINVLLMSKLNAGE